MFHFPDGLADAGGIHIPKAHDGGRRIAMGRTCRGLNRGPDRPGECPIVDQITAVDAFH